MMKTKSPWSVEEGDAGAREPAFSPAIAIIGASRGLDQTGRIAEQS